VVENGKAYRVAFPDGGFNPGYRVKQIDAENAATR
jgi:hypothetical protein